MASKPYDPTLKALVDLSPGDWPVLAGLPPAPTEVLDTDLGTISASADKVLRVGAAPPYLLHLEFISGHDATEQTPVLLLRNVLLTYRHALDVCSAVVVLRPGADSPTLTGELVRTYPGERSYLTFRYRVIRVWELDPEQLLTGGPALLPLAPISDVTKAELPEIIQRMKERVGRRGSRRFRQLMWEATWILLGLRYSADVAEQLLRGVLSMKESSVYQAILQEGLAEGRAAGLVQGRAEGKAQGRAQGQAEGRAEGRAEGQLAGARRMLLLQGETRYGSPPDTEAAAALEAITDLQRLEQLGVDLMTASGWRHLLGLPTPRRRNGRRPRSS